MPVVVPFRIEHSSITVYMSSYSLGVVGGSIRAEPLHCRSTSCVVHTLNNAVHSCCILFSYFIHKVSWEELLIVQMVDGVQFRGQDVGFH